jgi:hypothetical protein
MKAKTIFKAVAATAVLSAVMSVSALAASSVSVTIDGGTLATDTPAQIVEGRTMVPMRAIFEALGASIEWNSEEKSVKASTEDTVIQMTIGASSFSKNGQSVALDTPAMIIDGRTMVPVRAVSESLGYKVAWDAETKTVIITSDSSSATEADTETTTEGENESYTVNPEDVVYPDWIKAMAKSAKRPSSIPNSVKSNADLYKLHTTLKYNYLEFILPITVKNREDDFASLLTSKSDLADEIKSEWALNYLSLLGYVDISSGDVKLTEAYDRDADELASFYNRAGLAFEDNISIDIGQMDNGNQVVLLSISDSDFDDDMPFMAWVYNKEDGFSIFTLERVDDYNYSVYGTDGFTFSVYPVCLRSVDGDWGDALTSPTSFLYIVNDIVTRDIQPAYTGSYDDDEVYIQMPELDLNRA